MYLSWNALELVLIKLLTDVAQVVVHVPATDGLVPEYPAGVSAEFRSRLFAQKPGHAADDPECR